jgi:hypothetical protein
MDAVCPSPGPGVDTQLDGCQLPAISGEVPHPATRRSPPSWPGRGGGTCRILTPPAPDLAATPTCAAPQVCPKSPSVPLPFICGNICLAGATSVKSGGTTEVLKHPGLNPRKPYTLAPFASFLLFPGDKRRLSCAPSAGQKQRKRWFLSLNLFN